MMNLGDVTNLEYHSPLRPQGLCSLFFASFVVILSGTQQQRAIENANKF